MTAPHPKNRGNRSLRSLECRSSSMHQKSSKDHSDVAASSCHHLRKSRCVPNLREVVQRFGLIPAEAMRLDGLIFVTSFFLHAGIIRLAGNMYFCWRLVMRWKIFCGHCVTWPSLYWQHPVVIWPISLLIPARRQRALAPAAALPASLRFTN